MLLNDPSEAAPSAVGSPTNNRQVLETLEVAERRYRRGNCRQGGARVRSQFNTHIITKYDLKNLSLVHLECNLPREESLVVKHLIQNKNLVVSKTDKRDTTVIMSTTHYLDLAYCNIRC